MDQYTTVEHRGYFQRLKSSIAGVLIGILFFIGSFFVLWINEGNYARERKAIKELAATAVEGSVEQITPATAGKPVHLTGELLSDELVGDPGYLLPGAFLMLERHAEMYQWTEEEQSETKEKMGGGSETVTTYTYRKEWKAGRVDSDRFKRPDGHQNPQPAFFSQIFSVTSASFGAWDGMDVLGHIWPVDEVTLNDEIIDPELTDGERLGSFVYFRANPDASGDSLGDERIAWSALYPGTYSVLARHDASDRLTPVVASNGKEKFLVEPGAKSLAGMIETEKSAQSMLAWIFRAVGFVVMWIGLGLILEPLATLLSILPIAASIGRFAIGLIAFSVSIGMTVVTVIISWVAHNPVVLAVAIAGGLALALWWVKRRMITPEAPRAA